MANEPGNEAINAMWDRNLSFLTTMEPSGTRGREREREKEIEMSSLIACGEPRSVCVSVASCCIIV